MVGADEWLTLEEAGELLSRSPATLRVQIRLHALAAEKRDGVWAVNRAAVEDYRRRHLGRKGWAKRLPPKEE